MNVKSTIEKNKIRQWEIAEVMGISEFTLSRWLRKPEQLPEDKKKKVESAISLLLRRA